MRLSITSPPMPENKWGLRHVIGIMGFFAVGIGYIHRFCLSLAITEMVTQTAKSGKIDELSCPLITNATTTTKHAGEFDWDEQTQGLILSSFFWGYVFNQLPGGLMAERWGVKWVLGIGMMVSTLGTMLTPLVSRTLGAWGLICIRAAIGLGQGPLYPSLNVLMSNWSSANERGRLGAIVFAGAPIGNFLSMAVSGLLISVLGWTGVFYVFGGIGIVWFICWLMIYYNSPLDHPYIKENEKTYIITTSGRTHHKDLPPTPWIPILTSIPLWGLIIAQVGHDWGLFTIITDLPKYMKSVLHVSVKENGLISGLPYLGMWIFAILSGWVVDWMIIKLGWGISLVRNIFITIVLMDSPTVSQHVRRSINDHEVEASIRFYKNYIIIIESQIASVGPALGIIAASYSGCDKVLTSVFFIFGMTIMGAFIPSLKVNALDLSPNYAGTMMAIVGGIGAISGILTPYLVGILTPNSTLLEWRLVFWISVVVLMGTNFIYLFMGTAKVQWWNDPDQVRNYSENRKKAKDKEPA